MCAAGQVRGTFEIASVQSTEDRYGHRNARPEVAVVASSTGSPERFAICHAAASVSLQTEPRDSDIMADKRVFTRRLNTTTM